MNKIIMDGREIEFPTGVTSIGQILGYVDKKHLAENSVVSQIVVNGRPFIPNGFSGEGQQGITHGIEEPIRIEICTGNLAEAARASISAALAYLDRIEMITPSLANGFRADPSSDSLEDLRQLYEGFCWLNLLRDRLKGDFPGLFGDAANWRSCEQGSHGDFVAALKRLKELRESGEYGGMSDLLEQGMLPLVPHWREMLAAAARKTELMQ